MLTLALFLAAGCAAPRPQGGYPQAGSAAVDAGKAADARPTPTSIFDADEGDLAIAQAVMSYCGPQTIITPSLFFFTDPNGMSLERFAELERPHPGLGVVAGHHNDFRTWRRMEFSVSPVEMKRMLAAARPLLERERNIEDPYVLLVVVVVSGSRVWGEELTVRDTSGLHRALFDALDPANLRGRELLDIHNVSLGGPRLR